MTEKTDGFLRWARLKFVTEGNAKVSKDTAILNLPAGHTCPGASACLTKASMDDGRIKDGPQQTFRCYAATEEFQNNAREMRWFNFELLRLCGGNVDVMMQLIARSLPANRTLVRIHSSGDFFSQAYFDAWVNVAIAIPEIQFYAYTKSLRFWVAQRHAIPANLLLTASRGGKFDWLIDQHDLRSCTVVRHPDEAVRLNLEIDHDESIVTDPNVRHFAVLLHGNQPKGSAASQSLATMREEGIEYRYSALKEVPKETPRKPFKKLSPIRVGA